MGAVHALATVVLIGPRAAATAAHARALAAPLVKATVQGGAAGVTGAGGHGWLLVSTSDLRTSVAAIPGRGAGSAAGDDGDGGGGGGGGGSGGNGGGGGVAGGNWATGEARAAAAAAAAGAGLVIRVAGPDTDAVYALLREALRPLAAELGAAPFAERGVS